MISYLRAYIAAAVAFVALDASWLSVMGTRFYKPLLQGLLADTVRPVPALLFYILYVGGIVAFAVTAGAASGRLASVIIRGAGFGLVAYATYDLTNQATMRTWPAVITIADLAWGMFATAVAASAGYLAWRWQARI
jgi:uncharacterized membrane protein